MTQLQKKLSLYGLTMIAVGSCIGAGIFITPYEVARAIPHHGFVLFVWFLGGLVALTGALTFAELGGMFPKAGGVYVFLKEAYGDLVGFLYGWVILLVINTGALAALGLALAEYLTFFFPMSTSMKITVAILIIGSLTAINCVGINVSQLFANIFTSLKLLAILGIILVGIYFFQSDTINLQFNLLEEKPESLFSNILLALIAVLWSFGGWHHASYLAGETLNPQRIVPRAMILGASIVTLTYILINLAFMLLMPLSDIAQTTTVAGDALEVVFPAGGKIVTIAIAISIFGTIGIYTMSAPRIYYAMAKDGIFFSKLATLNPRFHTPVYAMVLQAVWAILLLIFWETFENLITYVTFMDIVFMALGGFSVFLFRWKRKDWERPYRVWGYPFIPIIYVGIATAFVINTLIIRPEQALMGIALLLIGLGVFRYFKRIKNQGA